MKTFKNQARQGDVFLLRVRSVPADAKQLAREGGKVVLAHGEATGHTHSFGSARVTMYAVADEFERVGCGYVVVTGKQATPLAHQEHTAVPVPPGTYRVIRQRAYQEGQIQRVED